MVFNYAAAAAPSSASNVLWDEERERQAYAAHLRSSSYQLHSRQRSALGSAHSSLAAGEGPLSSHGRQGSGVSSEDDAHSHASYQGLYYSGDAPAPARSSSGGSGDCRGSTAGYSNIPEFRKMPSQDSLTSDVPPPPPMASVLTSISDAASDNTSLQGDGESLTYDLDDIDRALASDVPERDPASLTHIRYGPGHEKYPSWPVPASSEPESGPLSGGSCRSKSWTDPTDYPKDKPAGYTRPHAKKSLSATFQQQLNTVMEKCEKIGPESFMTPEQRAKSESPREEANMFPCMDRDGRELGDKDYNIPSPPERDYDERIERRPTVFTEDVVGPRSLCTPFLDQLRRDIALSPVENGEASDPPWTNGDRGEGDHQPRSGRDSVATVVTYSSSNSSNEAMRLYGSFSDISVMSSSTSRSDPHPDHQIVHSSRVRPPQRLLSENVLGGHQTQQQQRHRPEFKLAKSVDESLINGSEGAPQDVTDSRVSPKSPRSPAIDYSKPPSVTDRIKALESQSRESRRDLHSKSVPNLLADKWSWKGSSRLEGESTRATDADVASNPSGSRSYRSGRSLDQTASDRDRDVTPKERDGDGGKRRTTSRSVSSERCFVAPAADTETRRKSFQVGSQDTSTLKAIQKQAVMSYYERQMSRTATSPSHSTASFSSLPSNQMNGSSSTFSPSRLQNQSSQSAPDCPASSQPLSQSHVSPTADPKVPEKHERGYRAGPTLWRVPESLQPDSARPRPAASRSRGASRRSSSASDRTNISTCTSGSNSSSRSSGSRTSAESGEPLRDARQIMETVNLEGTVCTSSASSSDGQSVSIQSSGKSNHSRSSSRDEQPPERPPKKPHLRALSGGAGPQVASAVQQQVVAGTTALLTQSPSTASSTDAAPPPRRPPKSPCIRKPAMPEPASLTASRATTSSPELPPPPPPPPALNESLNVSDEPLPPPPPALLQAWPAVGANGEGQSSPAPPLSPSGSQQGSYHKDSYMAHRREWKFGYEGRYRRTLSPSPPRPTLQEPASPSPPPPPPPATAPPATIGRSVSYAAPRSVEASAAKLKPSTSTGRLSEGAAGRLSESGKVIRQPSTTVVFTDAELRAFRAREQRAKEMTPGSDEDKENRGLPSPEHTSPLRQLSAPSTSDSAPQPRSPSPQPATVYRSPMADAKSERFSAYKKYSEIKPSYKPVVSPPTSMVLTPPPEVEGRAETEVEVRAETEAAPGNGSAPPRTAMNGSGDVLPPDAAEAVPVAANSTVGTLGRRKTAEEIECERLSKAFVSRAEVDDRLQNLLVPGPEHRTSAHYIQGLFDLSLTQGGPRPPAPTNGVVQPSSPVSPPAASPDRPCSETSPLRPDSAYFTTSASKAKFLTQYARDVSADQSLKNVKNLEEVRQQQEELVSRISRKLEILRSEQQSVRQEISTNAALGETVATRVQLLATAAEADKYATYVEQIGTITSLLLGLSGRLARAENALGSLSPQDGDERANLITKRDKLSDQLEEARKLKENVDRRSRQVATMLTGYLSEEELSDYQHFIQMKAKLIIDSREIEDKLRLGEEQLAALTQT